jgi:hypothetical protein
MYDKTNRIQIKQYYQLINEKENFNAFLRSDSFNILDLTESEKLFLKQINIIELNIKRESYTLKNLDEIFDTLYLLVSNFMFENNKLAFAIITEHMPKPISKLRSYKGMFDFQTKNDITIMQVENILESNYSIMVGIIKLSKTNINFYLQNYFNDPSNCCFFSTHADFIFSKNYLNNFSKNYMTHNSTSTIDYCKLALDINEIDSLIRSSGDGGNTCASFQIFQNINQTERNINNIQLRIKAI